MIQIDVADLKVGMQVTGVIDPKTKGSVKRCGVVRNEDVIQQLKNKGIKQVYISHLPDEQPLDTSVTLNEAPLIHKKPNNKEKQTPHIKASQYSALDRALSESKKVFENYSKVINSNGQVDANESIRISNLLTDNIILDKDSLILLTLAKNQNSDLFEHLVNTGVLSGIFAKSLGYDRTIIQHLVLAGLFHDIGKVLIPKQLTHTACLNPEPSPLIKGHIALARDILNRQFPDMPAISKTAALQSCERINGSGYPSGRFKNDISFFAKIIAIVDQFEMIRSQQDMDSTLIVLKALLSEADKSLSTPLVHQFIKCIGSYPPGTLVLIQQHQTQRLALVTHFYNSAPTKPKVKVFYNVNSKHYIKTKNMDLSSPHCGFSIKGASSPKAFNIDMSKLLNQYFFT